GAISNRQNRMRVGTRIILVGLRGEMPAAGRGANRQNEGSQSVFRLRRICFIVMPQALIFLRHPEVPAHHTTAIATCTCVRGPRRMAAPAIAACSYSASPGPSPFEARPAEEAGLAPQGDGGSESLATVAAQSTLSKSALRSTTCVP